jgi:hypothetical protein
MMSIWHHLTKQHGNRLPTSTPRPLTTIEATVSARLGTTQVTGDAQPAVFNRRVAMYLVKAAPTFSLLQRWLRLAIENRDAKLDGSAHTALRAKLDLAAARFRLIDLRPS